MLNSSLCSELRSARAQLGKLNTSSIIKDGAYFLAVLRRVRACMPAAAGTSPGPPARAGAASRRAGVAQRRPHDPSWNNKPWIFSTNQVSTASSDSRSVICKLQLIFHPACGKSLVCSASSKKLLDLSYMYISKWFVLTAQLLPSPQWDFPSHSLLTE